MSNSTKRSTSTKLSSTKAAVSETTPTIVPKKVKKEVKIEQVDSTPQVETKTDGEKKVRARRVVNKESVDKSFDDLEKFIELEVDRLKTLKTDKGKNPPKGIKMLRSLNKKLKVLHQDCKRLLKLRKKTPRQGNNNAGFLKPVRISDELAGFTGFDAKTPITRVEITKNLCSYIKKNGLFNKDDQRLILPDDKLAKLLKYDPKNIPKAADGTPEPLNYFRLQRYLKDHFIKIETPNTQKPVKKSSKPKSTVVAKTAKPVATEQDDVEEEEVADD
jgi:chromatin remodeling complex protein RSC6